MVRSLRLIAVICLTQLRRILIDRSSALWLFAMPLALVGILGMSLQGLMATDFTPARPYTVALAATGSYEAVQAALESRPGLVDVRTAADEHQARQSVLRRETDAAVIVPQTFPTAPAEVVAVPGAVIADILGELLHSTAIRIEQTQTDTVFVTKTELSVSAESAEQNVPPWLQTNSFAYYAIAITAMFSMFAAHTAMITSAQDRASDAYGRIRTLGVTPASYMMAGAVTGVIVSIIFIAAMSAATALLFGVAWGPVGPWAVLTVVSATAAAGLSLLVMALVPSADNVDGAGSAVFNVLAFLGGSMTPLPVLPSWFRTSLSWLPNRGMLDGYLKLARGADTSAIASELSSLAGAAAALFALAWLVLALRTKREAH